MATVASGVVPWKNSTLLTVNVTVKAAATSRDTPGAVKITLLIGAVRLTVVGKLEAD